MQPAVGLPHWQRPAWFPMVLQLAAPFKRPSALAPGVFLCAYDFGLRGYCVLGALCATSPHGAQAVVWQPLWQLFESDG